LAASIATLWPSVEVMVASAWQVRQSESLSFCAEDGEEAQAKKRAKTRVTAGSLRTTFTV
jgi:hypothetical protein